MSLILKEVIRIFGVLYELKNNESFDYNIKILLTYISFFNCLNILINAKISSIVVFYFIKYGGFRQILITSKKFLNFCKEEFSKNKKDIPIIELLMIKNFWSLLVSLMLFLIKYSFFSHNGFYLLLIRENNLTRNFNSMIELDSYIKHLILKDFIDIFFDKNDLLFNVSMVKDLEIYSNELIRTMFILLDNCCRVFSTINNLKKDELNIKELFNKGYQVYEIVQVIQEGKKNNEDIIKQIDEYRKKEKNNENNNSNDNNNNKEKDTVNNNNNNISGNLVNNNNSNNNSHNNTEYANNFNNNIIRILAELNNQNQGNILNKPKESEKINLFLKEIEEIILIPEESFITNIKDIFQGINPSKEIQVDISINNFDYSKESFSKDLNYIYDILSKCDISNKKVNDIRKMNIKYRIKNFQAKGDIFPYLEELIKSMRENREKLKDSNNEEEIFKKELDYKMYINYSIFRYKTHIKFSEIVDEKKCFIFFDLIDDSLNLLKELITKDNKINIYLRKKLIYENILNIYIQFCFLEYNKKNFEEKKLIF